MHARINKRLAAAGAALFAMLLETILAAPAMSAPLFESWRNLAVGNYPNAVACADVNEDGVPDLLVSEGGPQNVSVWIGSPGGTFAPAAKWSIGTVLDKITAADLDGDGHQDAVVLEVETGRVSVALGRGDGTFHVPIAYPAAITAVDVAAGDLNSDGHIDLVVADYSSDSLVALLGRGDGTFSTPIRSACAPSLEGVALADFDEDGRLDVVATAQGRYRLIVAVGVGNGSFAPRSELAPPGTPMWVKAADLNADGHQDVVEIDFEGYLTVFLGRGDGTFENGLINDTAYDPYSLAIADLDGNGVLDVAVAIRSSDEVCVFLGNGDGTFRPRLDLATGSRPTCVIAADVSGDHHTDLVVTNAWANRIDFLRNTSASVVAVTASEEFASLSPTLGPNPSSTDVRLRFRLARSSFTEVRVRDVSGRSVRHLDRGWLSAGEHQLVWNGADDAGHRVRAGLYFVEVASRIAHETCRVTMLR